MHLRDTIASRAGAEGEGTAPKARLALTTSAEAAARRHRRLGRSGGTASTVATKQRLVMVGGHSADDGWDACARRRRSSRPQQAPGARLAGSPGFGCWRRQSPTRWWCSMVVPPLEWFAGDGEFVNGTETLFDARRFPHPETRSISFAASIWRRLRLGLRNPRPDSAFGGATTWIDFPRPRHAADALPSPSTAVRTNTPAGRSGPPVYPAYSDAHVERYRARYSDTCRRAPVGAVPADHGVSAWG